MRRNKIFKFNIISDDPKQIDKFLSDGIFSKKIINPMANVGVIEKEDMVVQVEVVPERRYKNSNELLGTSETKTFKLDDETVSKLYKQVKELSLLD